MPAPYVQGMINVRVSRTPFSATNQVPYELSLEPDVHYSSQHHRAFTMSDTNNIGFFFFSLFVFRLLLLLLRHVSLDLGFLLTNFWCLERRPLFFGCSCSPVAQLSLENWVVTLHLLHRLMELASQSGTSMTHCENWFLLVIYPFLLWRLFSFRFFLPSAFCLFSSVFLLLSEVLYDLNHNV